MSVPFSSVSPFACALVLGVSLAGAPAYAHHGESHAAGGTSAMASADGAGRSAEGSRGSAAAAATAGATESDLSSSASVGGLQVENGWMRATAPGQSVGGGFIQVNNRGGDDRLVAASSPVAASVELHTMSMDNNVMRMREVPSVDLPAGKTVELRPGGLHLMFLDLKAPLKAGETVPVTLRFEKAGEVTVSLRVEAMGAMGVVGADHGRQH